MGAFSKYTMSETSKILVGKIVAPQGIRGEFRVQTYTASPMDFQKFEILCDCCVPNAFHFVRRLNPTSDVIVAKIDGINDRTAAEGLRGTQLFITRDALPETSDGEYYQSDLIGFTVVRDNRELGRVACFQNYGAGDIIELDNGDMVSFLGADVDMANKIITV